MKYTLRIVLFSAAFFLINLIASSQAVNLITQKQLSERLMEGGDTIFVVNFWATWCPPCVEELPLFDRSAINFMEPPVKFLLISLDFKNQMESRLIPFVKNKHVREEVLMINESNPNEWLPKIDEEWSGAIPATLVYNSKMSRKVFHEGEVTMNELLKLINKAIDN